MCHGKFYALETKLINQGKTKPQADRIAGAIAQKKMNHQTPKKTK